jgi:hypothetical protein
MLMNVGPMGDGSLRPLDKAMLETLGEWVNLHKEAVYLPRPCDVKVTSPNQKDFVLEKDGTYYLFCHDITTSLDNVDVVKAEKGDTEKSFALNKEIARISWLANGEQLDFTQQAGEATLYCKPHLYGENYVVRVAKIEVKA